MANRRSVVATAVLVLAVASAELTAQKGSTPNGKPFQQIQSQFDAVNLRIQALQTQITRVEQALAAEIDGINAAIASLETSTASVEDAIASIDSRIGAHAAIIAALQESVGDLRDALAGVQAELAQNTDAAAILALQTQAAQLRTLIDQHTGQIGTLQGQVSAATAFLATMANATCSVGQAIADIQPFGVVTCLTPVNGGVEVLAAQRSFGFPAGLHTFVVNCPLGTTSVGGGYDGVVGMTVVGSFPATSSSWTVRLQFQPPPLTSPFGSVTVHAKCVKQS